MVDCVSVLVYVHVHTICTSCINFA